MAEVKKINGYDIIDYRISGVTSTVSSTSTDVMTSQGVNTAMATESSARSTEDTRLDNRINTTNSNLDAEAATRSSADSALGTRIDNLTLSETEFGQGKILDKISETAGVVSVTSRDLVAADIPNINQNQVNSLTTDLATITTNIGTNTTDIATINSKIPNAATSSNQLADKDFVNSSITHMAANYVTATASGDQFPTVYNLQHATAFYHQGLLYTIKENDYAIITEDETHEDQQARWGYDGAQWNFLYTINATAFTSDQWAAINSKATEEKISSIAFKATKGDYTSTSNGAHTHTINTTVDAPSYTASTTHLTTTTINGVSGSTTASHLVEGTAKDIAKVGITVYTFTDFTVDNGILTFTKSGVAQAASNGTLPTYTISDVVVPIEASTITVATGEVASESTGAELATGIVLGSTPVQVSATTSEAAAHTHTTTLS